jgi:acetate kinase
VTETVLVVNAGSSSITFQLFSVVAGDQLERRRLYRRHWRERAGKMLISRAGSRASCYLIPTDEELMIARHTLRVMYAHNAGHA